MRRQTRIERLSAVARFAVAASGLAVAPYETVSANATGDESVAAPYASHFGSYLDGQVDAEQQE